MNSITGESEVIRKLLASIILTVDLIVHYRKARSLPEPLSWILGWVRCTRILFSYYVAFLVIYILENLTFLLSFTKIEIYALFIFFWWIVYRCFHLEKMFPLINTHNV